MSTPRKPSRSKPIDPLLQHRQAPPAVGSQQRRLPPPAPSARPVTGPRIATATAPAPAAGTDARLAALAARRQGAPVGPRPTGTPAGRRAKPARNAKLAALGLSALSTLGLAGMFAVQNASADSSLLTSGADPLLVATTAAGPATTVAAGPARTSADATPATTATTTSATTAPVADSVADGTYVGAPDRNRWGTVQVQAVYSGGTLVDVQILQYPNADNKSVRINQRSLPTLVTEALTAQSGNVDTVSGATYTSNSYRSSLQSAIDAANTSITVAG